MTKGGHNFIDLTDQVFGELTALSYNKGTKTVPSTWTCQCSCKRINKRDAGVRRHIEQDGVEGTRISALKQKVHKDSTSGVKGVYRCKPLLEDN